MKIIELYGYSGSGKSYLAKHLNKRYLFDLKFIEISRKNKVQRLIYKIYFLFNCKFSDIIFVFKIHKFFKFNKILGKIKNIFSLFYVIGFMRNTISKNKSVIIDHGIFQCIFSCFLQNKNSNINIINSTIFEKYFYKIFTEVEFEIIAMETDLQIIKKRLKKDSNIKNLYFLQNNENKIRKIYYYIFEIVNKINCHNFNFKVIK